MNSEESLKIAAESERMRQSSSEFLWILQGVVPPKLDDVVSTTAELTNSLRRRADVTANSTASFGETRLDYSTARPPASRGYGQTSSRMI